MTAAEPTGRPDPDPTAPDCPRCCVSPLRFVSSGDCRDSTGGGVYSCATCGFSTARDVLVLRLLRELRDTRVLLERFGRMALPGFVRELVAPEHRCPECEAKWRQAVVDAVQGAAVLDHDVVQGDAPRAGAAVLDADDVDGTGRAGDDQDAGKQRADAPDQDDAGEQRGLRALEQT